MSSPTIRDAEAQKLWETLAVDQSGLPKLWIETLRLNMSGDECQNFGHTVTLDVLLHQKLASSVEKLTDQLKISSASADNLASEIRKWTLVGVVVAAASIVVFVGFWTFDRLGPERLHRVIVESPTFPKRVVK